MNNENDHVIAHLIWANKNLENISELEKYPNLISLDVSHNQIRDISVLALLPKLKSLALQHNKIVDISPILGLEDFEYLNLSHNYITKTNQKILIKALPKCMIGF